MKKHGLHLLVLVTVAFASLTLGLFLGRNYTRAAVELQVSPALQTVPAETTPPTKASAPAEETIGFPININTATEQELMALPGIGEVLARRIIAYRQEHGSFETPESLMNVQDIGEKRIEAILDLITIGG